MARTQPLQEKFLGFQRDPGRDQIPQGYCYDIVDFLPNIGAPIRKRGGWSYIGSSLTTINPLLGNVKYVGFGPFEGLIGNEVVAIDDSSFHLVDITNSVDRGAWQNCIQAPIFYRDMIIGAGAGGVAPKKYTGNVISALGGTAPFASNLCVHKDRLLATDQLNNLGKIFFSDAGDPTVFDTTNRFLNTSATVIGMASLGNAVVVFHKNSVERIRGSIPPGSAAADMQLDPLFKDVGLYEPNAFAVTDDSVIWADEDGIYESDGASFSDLTKQGGIKQYWIDEVATAAAISATIAVGVWRGWAFVSLLDSTRGYRNFLMCDIKTRSWFRCSGITAKNFISRPGSPDQFYFSNQATKQIGDLSTIFTPATTNQSDATTGDVKAVLDTAYFTMGTRGKKRFKNAYLGYEHLGSGTLDVSFATAPESTTYTAAASFPAATAYTRSRARVPRGSYGFSMRIAHSTNTSDLKLYSIEAEATPEESSRR